MYPETARRNRHHLQFPAAGAHLAMPSYSAPTSDQAQHALELNTAIATESPFPLLPTTISGSATVGCGGYTTQPTANKCPSATPTPTPTYVAWDSAQCTQQEVTDASIDQSKRWASVNTEDAWTAAIDNWNSINGNGLVKNPRFVSR